MPSRCSACGCNGSYKLAPAGNALALTHVLIAVTLIAAVLGAVNLLRIRAYALAGWIAADARWRGSPSATG